MEKNIRFLIIGLVVCGLLIAFIRFNSKRKHDYKFPKRNIYQSSELFSNENA